MNGRRVLLAAVVGAVITACGDYKLEPLPLDVTIQANPSSVTAGGTINFVVSAQGGTLVSVAIDFGDGTDDLYPTAGARTARVTFSHAYSAAGTFQVQATVNDAGAGSKTATTPVIVN